MPHQSGLRRGRVSITNQIYLVTICTDQRRMWFADFDVGRMVACEMRVLHDAGLLKSLAWVLMPDHLHWLFALRDVPLPRVINRFKSKSASAVNRAQGRFGAIWQAGYHDRALRLDEDVQTAARYVVANPVRAGLVGRVGDYPLWDAIWL